MGAPSSGGGTSVRVSGARRGGRPRRTTSGCSASCARQLLLRLGSKRFGPPPQNVESDLQKITALERLEQLAERLLEAENWQELLQ